MVLVVAVVPVLVAVVIVVEWDGLIVEDDVLVAVVLATVLPPTQSHILTVLSSLAVAMM
jgi:hypothetical protein